MQYRRVGNIWYKLPENQIHLFDYFVRYITEVPEWYCGLVTRTFQTAYERFQVLNESSI